MEQPSAGHHCNNLNRELPSQGNVRKLFWNMNALAELADESRSLGTLACIYQFIWD
jgi:hypothetical protein